MGTIGQNIIKSLEDGQGFKNNEVVNILFLSLLVAGSDNPDRTYKILHRDEISFPLQPDEKKEMKKWHSRGTSFGTRLAWFLVDMPKDMRLEDLNDILKEMFE